ncbi:MAG: hypothetical protein SGI90_10640 [Candidatus Eisenbacteria bacterium]|nr:hypothetical protein [Candidatus Eisenbacteria bacterium]
MTHDVVAHYLDGTLIKGACLSVDPKRPMCHVQTRELQVVQVNFVDLKALFFVRSFEGDPGRHDVNSLDPDDPRRTGGRVVELQFKDGELLVGITPRFPPTKPHFFVLPADRNSNNDRMLVNRAACTSVTAVADRP